MWWKGVTDTSFEHPKLPIVSPGSLHQHVKTGASPGSDPAFGVNVDSTYHPVTYQMLQRFIKTSVAQLGLDPRLFSSHSLRRAGASWAFRAWVPGELIKTQGDWASQAYLRYLEFSLTEICQVAQRMRLEIQKEGL